MSREAQEFAAGIAEALPKPPPSWQRGDEQYYGRSLREDQLVCRNHPELCGFFKQVGRRFAVPEGERHLQAVIRQFQQKRVGRSGWVAGWAHELYARGVRAMIIPEP